MILLSFLKRVFRKKPKFNNPIPHTMITPAETIYLATPPNVSGLNKEIKPSIKIPKRV